MRQFITLPEAEKLGFDKSNISNETIETFNEVSKLHECTIMISHENYDNKDYFEYSLVFLVLDLPINISIRKNYDKEYRIFSDNYQNLPNVNTRYDEPNLPVPNKVKKLSLKKIQDWVNYNLNKYNHYKAISDENTSKINAFLNDIKGEQGLTMYNSNKEGYIERNGIILRFKIYDGYIDQKVEISYKAGNNIETFRKLADNKF